MSLPPSDRAEAFELASAACGREPFILEKDTWVVWALSVVFAEGFGGRLAFKGGTSLSKAYGAIDRFSEDVDLTHDIRPLLADVPGVGEDGLPETRSQSKRWTEAARERLAAWISADLKPVVDRAIEAAGLEATTRVHGLASEKLGILYRPSVEALHPGGYVAPEVTLELGGRATGEPVEVLRVRCDAAPHVPGVAFPEASPRVMRIERTFWEKATAAHVFCAQGDLKGERFSRHWCDLAALSRHARYASMLADRRVADAVARHKAHFFRENLPGGGGPVDYAAAVGGRLRIVPSGEAAAALEADHAAMAASGMLGASATTFAEVMETCARIEREANAAAARG